MLAVLALALLAAGAAGGGAAGGGCPARCSCRALRLRCASLPPDLRAAAYTSLNLSGIGIPILKRAIFIPSLQKLDLSNNNITSIENDAFYNVTGIQRLDLSSNSISGVDKEIFRGLDGLERLLLNQNRISILDSDAFIHLKALKQIDITGNPLKCDCDLLWLVDWSQNSSVKLIGNPKCSSPASLDGQSLKKLKTLLDPVNCGLVKNVLQNELLLKPQNSQVVFEGDSLLLKCIAPFSSIKAIYNLTWYLPNTTFDIADVSIDNLDILEEGLAETILSITQLTSNHTGQYTCTYSKSNATDLSERIDVVVISNSTRYCPTSVTIDNKGEYTWPGSIQGNIVSQPCYNKEGTSAHYFCGFDGKWSNLNTSGCPYISETTMMLEHFALVNLSVVKGSVMGACQKLHTLLIQNTPPTATLNEPDDINFIVQAINNYFKYADKEKDLGSVLLDIVNTMMYLPQTVLNAAENIYNSCSSLVGIIEDISQYTSNIQGHKKNLALERFPIKRESFAGMTCVWYTMPDLVKKSENDKSRFFRCSTTNRTITPFLAERDKIIEASIQIPASLLYRMDHQALSSVGSGGIHRTYSLIVAMYDKASFFTKLPTKLYNHSNYFGINGGGWNLNGHKMVNGANELAITTPVVGVKLTNISLTYQLSDPIYIMVRDSGVKSGVGGKAVLWNEETKRWSDSPDGCSVLRIITNMVVIQCYKLGYVGLMQNVETGIYGGRSSGARFKFSHPAIYVGSTVLLTCLLAIVVTYILCYSAIHMAVRTKHSLINTWLAFSLLCFMYTLGIYQTEDIKLCQAVGILVHYFTLCCLLWISVTVSQLYKNLSKNQNPTLQSPEDESPDVLIQKPILGIYLVGWGIALIICGISGAVNMRDYASYSHCFLSNAPALSTVFVPAGIIIVFISILFLLIRCTIRNVNGQLSEGTQATENVDLEMWEPSLLVNNTADRQSERSTVESEIEDIEHTPIVQLRAHVIVLIIYLVAWGCGCIAIHHPFSFQFPLQEDVFSILYALFATTLGCFILFFYGIARSDVRSQWLLMQCYLRKTKKCCRTRSIFDTNAQNVTANHHPLAPISNAAAAQARSRSSSQNSNRTNSKSNNSNILKAAAELNSHNISDSLPNGNKISNMNLVVLHRQQYRSNNSVITFPEAGTNGAEIFYNANQSNVARKFFKKQRKHIRRNCLDIPRRHNFDTDSQVSSVVLPSIENMDGVSNLFTSGAKVNNTNIHVERGQLSDNGIKETRNQINPNILSDNDDKSNKPQLKRYVIEKEPPKQYNKREKPVETKVLNQNPIVMNIYTNIPETKVPQHQVVSSSKIKRCDDFEHSDVRKSCSVSGEGFDCNIESLPTMRTVSQQCSLEYSSTSEVATPLNQLGSDKTLNTHSELTSLQETHSALCSTHEITSDTDDAPSFDKYIDFKHANARKGTNKHYTSCSKLQNESTDTLNESVLSKKSLNRSLQNINTSSNDVNESNYVVNERADACESDNFIVGAKMFTSLDNNTHNDDDGCYGLLNKNEFESNNGNAVEHNFENESDIYFPNYQMSEVSIRSHGLYAPPPTSLCVNDLGFSNGELSHNPPDDDYENHYVNYNAGWRNASQGMQSSDLRYHSPAVSCPDVNRAENDSPVSLVSEIDELYKQITIKDRRYKKPAYNARHVNDRAMRHCESDSYISESHSDILEPDQKAETRV